jgi:hypothetical protein
MWNLSADDIQRAKEELKGRRAAIQARYENELKQLEVDIADLETFESFAVKFVTDFKGDAGPAPAAEAKPLADDVVAEIVAQVTAEPSSPAAPETPAAQSAAPAPEAAAVSEPAAAASAEPAAGAAEPGQRSSSRCRMRLNTGEAAP